MFETLKKLANKLDQKGYLKLADEIDSILNKVAQTMGDAPSSPEATYNEYLSKVNSIISRLRSTLGNEKFSRFKQSLDANAKYDFLKAVVNYKITDKMSQEPISHNEAEIKGILADAIVAAGVLGNERFDLLKLANELASVYIDRIKKYESTSNDNTSMQSAMTKPTAQVEQSKDEKTKELSRGLAKFRTLFGVGKDSASSSALWKVLVDTQTSLVKSGFSTGAAGSTPWTNEWSKALEDAMEYAIWNADAAKISDEEKRYAASLKARIGHVSSVRQGQQFPDLSASPGSVDVNMLGQIMSKIVVHRTAMGQRVSELSGTPTYMAPGKVK